MNVPTTRELTLHILFVCTGNICRSPTGERLAAAYVSQHGISDFTTSSAGTRAVIGHPIHPDAALVLRNLGGDVAGFSARQLTAEIAWDADLVIAMTGAQRDAVLEASPRQLQRTFTLTEAAKLATLSTAHCLADLATLRTLLNASDKADIPDPIGQRHEVFASVGAQIAELLPPIMEICRRSIRV